VPQQLEPSGKNLMLNGVFMEICDDSGRCLEIRRVREYLDTKESKWNN
jgi:calcineurin-like phosphoesterase